MGNNKTTEEGLPILNSSNTEEGLPILKKKEDGTIDSNDASQQQSQPSNQNGTYQWSSGGTSTPLAGSAESEHEGTVMGIPEEKITKHVQEMTGGNARLYIANKQTEKTTAYSDYLDSKDFISQANNMPKMQQYQQLQQQIKGTTDAKAKEALQTQADELGKQPLEDWATTFSGTTFEQTKHPELKGVTVGDAYSKLQSHITKANDAADTMKKIDTDVSNVVDYVRKTSVGYTGDRGFIVDAKSGVKELGIGAAFVQGAFGTIDNAMFAAKLLATAPEDRGNMYKERIAEKQVLFPERPANEAAALSGSIGGVAPYIALGGGIAGLATKGTLSTIGSIMVNGAAMGLTGYGDAGLETYQNVLSQTQDENKALEAANSMAKVGAATGTVMGVSIGLLPGGDFANMSIDQYLAKSGIKNTAIAGVSGLSRFIENKVAQHEGDQRESMDGVGSTMKQMLLLGGIMDALHYFPQKLTPAIKEAYENTVAKFGLPAAQEAMDKAIQEGQTTRDLADKTLAPIIEKNAAFSMMPPDLTVEQQNAILPDIIRKQQLLRQQENKVFPDTKVKSELEQIDRTINEKIGAPLTIDEQSTLEELHARSKEKDEDGKLKKPLTPTEQTLMEHLEARQKEKKPEEEKPTEKIADLASRMAKGEKIESPEDLQLQANHPKELEAELAKLKEKPDATTQPTTEQQISVAPHGDTKRDLENKISGQTPEPLSEEGKKQAIETGKDFAKEWDDKGTPKDQRVIIASPRERAQETAGIVAKETGATIQTNDKLDTWDVGDFHGARESDFKKVENWFAEHPDEKEYKPEDKNDPDYGKKIGESFNEFANRVAQAHEEITKNAPPDAKVITHGYVRKVMDAIEKSGGWNDEARKTYLESEKPENIALNRGETTETPTEGKVAGINIETMQKIADDLGIKAPESGREISPEDTLALGRELLKAGADPNKLMEDFDKGQGVTPEGVGIIRAEAERLTKESYAAADKYGDNSKEAIEANQKLEDFLAKTKPYATQASNTLKAYQGETEIDTGHWRSLRRAYIEEHGTEPTEAQLKEAKELAGKVKDLTTQVEDLTKKLDAAHKTAAPKAPARIKGKALIAEGIDDLTKALGLVKSFADEKRPEISAAVSKIARGLLDEGLASAENLWERVRQYVKDNLGHDLPDHYKDDATAEIEKSEKDDIRTRFVDKKGSDFTPEEAKAIWDYAKENYIDKDKNLGVTVSGVATDLGLTPEQVRDAIAAPKGTRKLTDEIYLKQGARRRAIRDAQEWAKYANQSKDSNIRKGLRALSHIPDLLFAAKVFGHGTVAPITHAGMDLFQPTGWKNYFKFFIEGFKNAYGSKAEYERRMEELRNDPMYGFAKRNGLAIDPDVRYDDYQTFNKYLAKGGILGKVIKEGIDIGDRGFNALKTYRLAKFKQLYDGLSMAEKADPNTAKELARIVNHSTGTSDFGLKGEGLNKALATVTFAPKLEYSRWQRLIVEPAKAGATIVNWKNSTPAEKAAAKIVTKKSGEMLATYAAALAANAGILALTGSKDKVNLTNPSEPDWLKFKAGGKELNPTGGMLSSVKFVGNLLGEAFSNDKDRKDKYYEMLGNYGRGKLSPFAGTIFDFATHKDYDKNILPPFNDRPTYSKFNKSFNHKMSWSEYAKKNLAPIPVAEAIKTIETSMQNKGMSDADIKTVLDGVFVGAASGLTGVNIKEGKEEKKPQEDEIPPQ